MSETPYLTPAELCALLRISRRTLARLDVPAHRISPQRVLYRRDEVDAWLAARDAEAA